MQAAGQRLSEARRRVRAGREAGRCASLGEAACWPGGRGFARRASEARAPVSALCDAAAGVARSGWLTMDYNYRSKRSFFGTQM